MSYVRPLPLLMLLALGATACGPADLSQHDYRISHPLTAEQRAATASFDGPTLSPFDQSRLQRLAAESVRRGSGKIEITLEAKPEEEDQAQAFAQQIQTVLKREGVGAITTQLHLTDKGTLTAEVRVPLWVAVLPECGSFDRGVTPDHDNAPNSNWGCSIQRNMALMLQNPADLVRARESSGRDGNRAADVLAKYGQGLATSSASETKATGSTSAVGGSK